MGTSDDSRYRRPLDGRPAMLPPALLRRPPRRRAADDGRHGVVMTLHRSWGPGSAPAGRTTSATGLRSLRRCGPLRLGLGDGLRLDGLRLGLGSSVSGSTVSGSASAASGSGSTVSGSASAASGSGSTVSGSASATASGSTVSGSTVSGSASATASGSTVSGSTVSGSASACLGFGLDGLRLGLGCLGLGDGSMNSRRPAQRSADEPVRRQRPGCCRCRPPAPGSPASDRSQRAQGEAGAHAAASPGASSACFRLRPRR